MNHSFYIGAVGAQQQLQRMNVQSNNIANVNTYGFKAEKARFTNLLYENLQGIDGAQLPMGAGASLLMTSTDHAQGGAVTTGRELDYMIEGDGFFALADLESGEISYTRDGSFISAAMQRPTEQLDENGMPVIETVFCLSDGNGRFVLSRQGELIELDGQQEGMLPIGIFDYRVYDGMRHQEGVRFTPVEKNGNLILASGTLCQGMLERSNVDLAEEITKVVESQRAYGMALKMVQVSDEIETTINNLNG